MENSKLPPCPKKGEKLFIETGGKYECSHFGWGDWRTQFYGYMVGYKNSADTLIDTAIDRAINSRDICTLDTFVFPICFSYRQYLELAIKAIYLEYSEDTKEEKIRTIARVNHDLMEIWNKITKILDENSDFTEEKESIKAVEDYLMQFHDLDKSSFTFRYPICKKDLESVFKSKENPEENFEMLLNLRHLKNKMDELETFFSGWGGKLSAIKEFKHEISEYFCESDY